MRCINRLRVGPPILGGATLRTVSSQRLSNVEDHSVSRRNARIAARRLPLASSPSTLADAQTGAAESAIKRNNGTDVPALHSRTAFVAGDAPVVYHRRLREGNFHNVSELLSAPYAPHPLKVLEDVLSMPSLRRTDGASSEPLVVSVLHVRHVYTRVLRDASQCLEECRLLEDRQSQRRMRDVMEKARTMQEFIESSVSKWEEDGRFDAHCNGGDALLALMAEQLKLTSQLGMVEGSVFNLQTVKRIQANAANSRVVVEDPEALDLADVVALETSRASNTVSRPSFTDDVAAMRSCVPSRNFDVALALFRQLTTGAVSNESRVSAALLSDAVSVLATTVRNTDDFQLLRKVLVDSDISAIPVSVELYSALIESSSRALKDPERLTFSLSLYRRLRDARLMPKPETYAALMAVTSSFADPSQTFAFYREALVVAGNDTSTFPPAIFTRLIEGYSNAKLYDDARKTLEVLIEASAPINRAAFHAVLSVAPTSREAKEILSLMEAGVNGVAVEPTPTTYALLLRATSASTRGVTSVLEAFDIHKACRTVIDSPDGLLAVNEPSYARALEDVCLGVAIDPSQDTRIVKYLAPLTSFVQKETSDYLGFPPQQPTVVPLGSTVLVLAADVLANVEEYVLPSAEYFSSLVIPYSAVALFRKASAKRSDFGASQDIVNPHSREEASSELLEARKMQLRRFLEKYHSVTHIMSLDEEVACSGDVARYGIPLTGDIALMCRSAAIALNLSRGLSTTKVYHDQKCRVVLATTKFKQCGRFVRDHEKVFKSSHGVDVALWDPKFEPHWKSQGVLSAERILVDEQQLRDDAVAAAAVATRPLDSEAEISPSAETLMELLALE
jgi:hypothetical protein